MEAAQKCQSFLTILDFSFLDWSWTLTRASYKPFPYQKACVTVDLKETDQEARPLP